MSRRVWVAEGYRGRIPSDWASWVAFAGSPVSVSRTTCTVRVRVEGIALYLKRHRYPLSVTLKAAFRHTFVRPSRPGREFRMLAKFRARAGGDVAPAPVALGERRILGFLREAFVATEEVPDAVPLEPSHLESPGAARALGAVLSGLRSAGLLHGRLFARNLLTLPDGTFRVVDLDRARARRCCGESHGIMAFVRPWAADLARLLESLDGLPAETEASLLGAFAGGDPVVADRWESEIARYRPAARRQLLRRSR